MLKPLINSLSPSRRSKGARFLSISDIIIHKTIQNKNISILKLLKLEILKVLYHNKTYTKRMINATSYDSLCKMPRILPNFEKTLTDLHPVKITE